MTSLETSAPHRYPRSNQTSTSTSLRTSRLSGRSRIHRLIHKSRLRRRKKKLLWEELTITLSLRWCRRDLLILTRRRLRQKGRKKRHRQKLSKLQCLISKNKTIISLLSTHKSNSITLRNSTKAMSNTISKSSMYLKFRSIKCLTTTITQCSKWSGLRLSRQVLLTAQANTQRYSSSRRSLDNCALRTVNCKIRMSP